MGSFNVTCCVSKTPIVFGEKCHLIIFSGIDQWDLIYSDSLGNWNISSEKTTIIHGIYDDYGRLKGCNHEFFNNSEPKDRNFGFYISDDAWKLGEQLIKKRDYERVVSQFRDSIKVNALLKNREKRFTEKEIDDREVVIVLSMFCNLNNFNIFDISFQNTYAGQSYCIEDKERFNILRKDRVAKLRESENQYL